MSYKAVAHLDHADMLEVTIYRKEQNPEEPIDSITVECAKCGEVVEEIYNADEDNTSPLDEENPRWLNNEVQFARLLCEIVAAYEGDLKDLVRDVGRSMDLSVDSVNELFDRAEEVWEKAKEEVK